MAATGDTGEKESQKTAPADSLGERVTSERFAEALEQDQFILFAQPIAPLVCHKAGLETIAQFVETSEALALVRKAGVDYAQGFRVAMPVPLALLS